MAKVRRMFPGGNTSKGFFSYHKYILDRDGKKIYILKGVPGGGKSSLMKDIAEEMLKQGFSIEYHHCPSDKDSVDGVVIEELNVAIVDGTFPHIIDPIFPGLSEKIINLGKYVDEDKLKINRDKIIVAKQNNKKCYRRAYSYFRSAKEIREEIKNLNKDNVDIGKVNREIEHLKKEIFKNIEANDTIGKERNLFVSAYTPQGYIDFTNTLVGDIGEIYCIEGELGTGKTMLLQTILKEAIGKGLDVEIYHNALVPSEIDTIIIPKLKIILTTSNIFSDNDVKVIDLNKYMAGENKKEEDYDIYKRLIDIGISSLKEAKKNHELLEEYYSLAVDYKKIDKEREQIIFEILNL